MLVQAFIGEDSSASLTTQRLGVFLFADESHWIIFYVNLKLPLAALWESFDAMCKPCHNNEVPK